MSALSPTPRLRLTASLAGCALLLLPACGSSLQEMPIYYADPAPPPPRVAATTAPVAERVVPEPASERLAARDDRMALPPEIQAPRLTVQNRLPAEDWLDDPAAEEAPTPPPVADSRTRTQSPSSRPGPTLAMAARQDPGPETATDAVAPSTGGEQQYYIDVGSFLMEENVAGVAKRITDMGLPVTKRAVRVGDKIYLRISAGPFPFKAEAEWAQTMMRDEAGIKGALVM
ncbi:MAG: SPOR domain-containing protein [Magnetococcales bacterium]|nr:SPOR domain-containing protein [Magnetococcales bacterium]